jgi:hypothetical protein
MITFIGGLLLGLALSWLWVKENAKALLLSNQDNKELRAKLSNEQHRNGLLVEQLERSQKARDFTDSNMQFAKQAIDRLNEAFGAAVKLNKIDGNEIGHA